MEFIVLKKSEAESRNATNRLDAEYFRKVYIDTIKTVESKDFSYVEDITSWVTQGPNPSFSTSGIPCLTGRNINKGQVSYVNTDFVDDEEYRRLSRYQLEVGDTLITLKGRGSIGKIGFVTNSQKAIFSRDVGIVRPSNIEPGYLNVFLLCKYGKRLIDRGETGGTGQSTLTTSYLKSIPIPRLSIENAISERLVQVEQLRKSSQNMYSQAEAILNSELGLSDRQPKHTLTFVRSYSETGQSSRIDAEYFQPKYDKIAEDVKSYPGGWNTLGDLVTLRDRNFKPKDKVEYNYVELSNIGGYGEITGCMVEEGQNLPTRARRKVEAGDVIVSSIEGSLSSIAWVQKDFDQGLCSTGFHVIRSKSIRSECLLVFLKSIAGQLQLKKGCSGTILAAISKDEFERIVLPIVADGIQKQIRQKITLSFVLLEKSNQLLDTARKAVEMAIESDERSAMQLLKEQARDNST